MPEVFLFFPVVVSNFSGLTLKSLIHFALIFFCGLTDRSLVPFFLFCFFKPIFPRPFVEHGLFSPQYVFNSLSQIKWL
jgi:hypothetical protein